MAGRGAGGHDAEGGAAERRLAEALQAQASLSARSAAPVKPGAKPVPPRRGAQKGAGQRAGQKPPGQKMPMREGANAAPVPPGHGQAASSGAPGTPPTRAGTPGGQSGPHGRRAPTGPHAAPRPAAAHPPAGRGQPVRPRDDQLPTTKVVTADASGAPTTQQPSARPPQPAAPAVAAQSPTTALLDGRRVALIVGLLAGVLLGCALALLSVLGPGVLPAIG
jgi:hypothetical protein